MGNVTLDQLPSALTGYLIVGDGRTWTATSSDGDWPGDTRLRILNAAGTETVLTPVIAATLATWTVTVAEVTALIGTRTNGTLDARITTGTGDQLRPVLVGKLSILSRWVGVRAAQSLGATAIGPAGPIGNLMLTQIESGLYTMTAGTLTQIETGLYSMTGA